MNKLQIAVITVMACFVLAGCSGCDVDSTDETQIKVIAQQAGLFSAVGWIALDNPTPAAIAVVRGLMSQIESASTNMVAGKTYTEVVYPPVTQYVDAEVETQYKPLAKAGVLAALNSLDLLFVMNPDWRKSEQLAHSVVQAFIRGAEGGLGLAEDDPIMVQARSSGHLRVQLLK
jgi:hypothetical protein